jgi:uncharacterized paraquat-inducible protein A
MSAEFDFWECPDCEYTLVLPRTGSKTTAICCLCSMDSGHEVLMRRRPARDDDEPEGPDARRADRQ